MLNISLKQITALVLVFIMAISSLGAYPGDIIANDESNEPDIIIYDDDIGFDDNIEVNDNDDTDSNNEFNDHIEQNDSVEQDDKNLLEDDFLTVTLGDPVGVQGFDGEYKIDSYDDFVEIIVQFVTPPSVALKLIQEREIQTRRTFSGISFEDQALSAHSAFIDQLASIMPLTTNSLSRSQPVIEIFSEYHTLFNGVLMLVPGSFIESIASLPEVYGVFPNIEYQTSTPPSSNFSSLISHASTPVNQSLLKEARALFGISDIHNGLNITGRGVQVAVLDTGIDHNHPEFAKYRDSWGRIPGWNFWPSDITATVSHGTAVSGCVIGIAPDIKLWNYRVQLGDGKGGVSPGGTAIGAVEAAHRDGADVINISFGSGVNHPFDTLSYAVNLAVLDGVVVVVSAGNSGSGSYTISVPGTAALALTVGAGTLGGAWSTSDNITDFSSRGPVGQTDHIKPDIIAPGYGIYTTSLNSTYAMESGTSFSAPIIAGVAALLLEAFPGSQPHEIKAMMMNTSRSLATGTANHVMTVGAGFVRPREALVSNTIVTVEHSVPINNNPQVPYETKQMASMSYGAVNASSSGVINRTNSISIKNRGSSSRTYSISYVFTNNPNNAGSFNFSGASIPVAAGNTVKFNASLNINNNAQLGIYEGYIVINGGGNDVARLPFFARVTGITAQPTRTTTISIPQINGQIPAPTVMNPDPVTAGTTVFLPAVTANPGFTFNSWVVTSGNVTIVNSLSPTGAYFVMGSQNVNIEARFLRGSVPSVPQNLTVNFVSGGVTIQWAAPANDGGAVISGYQVSQNGGASWLVASGNTSHTFTGLVNGVLYTFMVRAVNAVGSGAATSVSVTYRNHDAVELFVSRLYSNVLGRMYDADGLQFWTNRLLRGGDTGANVARGFFFSNEFINQRNNNNDFVEKLYLTLMDRSSDPGGKAFWVGRLDAGWPREDIFAGFVNSAEFTNICRSYGISRGNYTVPAGGMARVFATRLYRTTLQREPDEGGLNFWHDALRSGRRTGAAISYDFIFSPEMRNRNLSDDHFVEIMYNAMMGRDSDPGGKSFWLNRMRTGATRYNVFVSFINSPEFDRICRNHGIIRGVAPQFS